MSRPPVEEKRLGMEGKIYFFIGVGEDNWTAVLVLVQLIKILLRTLLSSSHSNLNHHINSIDLFQRMMSWRRNKVNGLL